MNMIVEGDGEREPLHLWRGWLQQWQWRGCGLASVVIVMVMGVVMFMGAARVSGREGERREGGRNGDAGSAGNNLCGMSHKLRICGSFLGKISSLSLLLTRPPFHPVNNSPARTEVSVREGLRAEAGRGTRVLCERQLSEWRGVALARCSSRLQLARAANNVAISKLVR